MRTDTGAFTAVGASTGNVKGSNNMKHRFLKAVYGRLAFNTRIGIVKYTLFAGAGRADVAAGIAANAFGKLVLPE